MRDGLFKFGDLQGLQEREGGAEVQTGGDFGQRAQGDLKEPLAVFRAGFTVAFGQVENR